MKKVYRVAVVVMLMFAPLIALGQPVLAVDAQCEISDTGPESNNECEVNQEYTCEISENNHVTIKNSNGQEVGSGNVEVGENGSGAGAVSGSASNENDTTFNVTITNSDTCEVAVVPPTETPETPENPETETPGRGEVPAPVQPSQDVTPTALPVTSAGRASVFFLVGGTIAIGVLVAVYRRLI